MGEINSRNKTLLRAFLFLSFVCSVTVVTITLSATGFNTDTKQTRVIYNFRPNSSPPSVTYSRRRFLMPALIFNRSGPQNNYLRFKSILPLVVLQNRSLVLYPIRNHKTQNNANETRNLNETFDVDRLKQFVSVVTPHEFYKECGGRAVIFDAYKRDDLLKEIFIDTGLQFEQIEVDGINGTNTKKTKSFEQRVTALQKHRCVIFRTLSVMKFKDKQWKELMKSVDRYLLKAPYIRELGKEGTKKICGGKSFLGFHWRNRTGERCLIWDQEKGCEFEELNLSHETQEFVEVFTDFMKTKNITCVYLAYPPFAQRMYAILRTNISKIFTKNDLLDSVPSIASHRDDNFVISLIEQEVIKHSTVFLGSKGSAWTQVAKSERSALKRPTVYLTSIEQIPKGVNAIN